jgi:uncharacterized protein
MRPHPAPAKVRADRGSRGPRAARHMAPASLVRIAALGATLAVAALALPGCAGQRDRFYTLATLPETQPAAAPRYAMHVVLAVSVPPVVDRRQMVIHAAGDQVVILEHERWAAPLSELVSQTLARDIERRKPDALVADRSFDQPNVPSVRIRLDIVSLTARLGGETALEAHWRIVDAASGRDEIGGEVFSAPAGGEDYAAVARAFSQDLAALADRLAQKLAEH